MFEIFCIHYLPSEKFYCIHKKKLSLKSFCGQLSKGPLAYKLRLYTSYMIWRKVPQTALSITLGPRGFTLQNTTPWASLKFPKWHPFHSITDPAWSNPFQSMTVMRIVNLIQTPNTLLIVQKKTPCIFHKSTLCQLKSQLAWILADLLKVEGQQLIKMNRQLIKQTHFDKQFS